MYEQLPQSEGRKVGKKRSERMKGNGKKSGVAKERHDVRGSQA